ncbi:hypothetical protein MRX96_026111 [Rhipicephalus microplus]
MFPDGNAIQLIDCQELRKARRRRCVQATMSPQWLVRTTITPGRLASAASSVRRGFPVKEPPGTRGTVHRSYRHCRIARQLWPPMILLSACCLIADYSEVFFQQAEGSG